jgi:hypothetical protein
MRWFLLSAVILAGVCFFAGQATAGSAIVVASNGVYASAWGPLLSAEGAAAKATELCQKKGGIDIKVLASAANGSVVGLSRGLVPSPHQDMDRAQLLDLAFDSLPVPKQTLRLLRCAERKAGQTRASWSPGLNEEVDGKTRRRALGPASCKSTISARARCSRLVAGSRADEFGQVSSSVSEVPFSPRY